MKDCKQIVLSFTIVLTCGSAWAQREPDFVWNRIGRVPTFVGVGNDDFLVVGSEAMLQGDCFVIRASDGQLVRTLDFGRCQRPARSRNGRFVALPLSASSGPYSVVRILVSKTWTSIADIGEDINVDYQVSFSPDHRYLVQCRAVRYGVPLGTATVWDADTWTRRFTLPATCRNGLSISPDSQFIVLDRQAPPSPGIFRLSDGADVTPVSGYPGGGSPLLGDGWIAFANADSIDIWNVEEPPRLINRIEVTRPSQPVLSWDGVYIAATFSRDGAIWIGLWDAMTFANVSSWSSGVDAPASTAWLGFMSDGTLLSSILGSQTGAMSAWSIPDGTLLRSLVQDSSIASDLIFSPDAQMVAGAFGPLGNIRLWRVDDGVLAQTIATGAPVQALAFSPDGNFLVSCCGNGLQSWRVADASLVQTVPSSATSVAVSSAGLVAEGTVQATNLRTLPDLIQLRTISRAGPISFSPEGRLILIDNTLFDVDSGKPVRTFDLTAPSRNVYSPDGRNVAFAHEASIKIFDARSGELVAIFGRLRQPAWPGFTGRIASLAYAPDGSLGQASGVDDRFRHPEVFLRIWDLNGNLLRVYDSELGDRDFSAIARLSLNYSANGRYFSLARSDGAFGVARNPCADSACSPPLPIATLYDHFATWPLNPGLWQIEESYGSISRQEESPGMYIVFRAEAGTGNAHVGLTSKSTYSLLNSGAHALVSRVPEPGDVNTIFSVTLDSDNAIQWRYENGRLFAEYSVGGVQSVVTELDYPGRGYWRIREDSGAVYWETSNGSRWVSRAMVSTADLFPLQSVRLGLSVNTFGGGTSTPQEAHIDVVNEFWASPE